MPESTSPNPPTFFANVATIHVNVDEVSIEFRRVMPPHSKVWELSKGATQPIPPWTDDNLYKVEPVAKVVLTFLGAKALRDNLIKLLPNFEELRKQGV